MTAIIIIAAVALIAFWVIGIQNKLVKVDELCKNALKQINVQQVSRYDALKALIKLTREYASYEGETLEKVISARRITSSPSPSEMTSMKSTIGSGLQVHGPPATTMGVRFLRSFARTGSPARSSMLSTLV